MAFRIKIGPGAIVAAAFIGPGTVTTCTVAGADFGYALAWALVFATISTIILQDMSARLGAAGLGLGEALMATMPSLLTKAMAGGLVILALGVGNAAYESGNLVGSVIGLEAISGAVSRPVLIGTLSVTAAAILVIGRYRVIEHILIGLVICMSLAFVLSAVIVRPDLSRLVAGLVPTIPEGSLLTTVALIGTTIVPYNLFLHAAAVRRHGPHQAAGEARLDSAFSIGLGGLVSILILSTAAASLFATGTGITSAQDMARSIEPVFGSTARYLVGAGLFAAGLTSAITAPMATAYALNEILLSKDKPDNPDRFRIIALSIVFIGAIIALLGIKPVSLILTAQVANGLLLPIIAVFLLIVMNRRSVVGENANSFGANIAGVLIILITTAIGARSLWRAGETALGG